MDLEGRLIGNRYEILEKIGNGGMATVYKAKCHVLNRNVAVKVLKEEFTTDLEFIKRFNIEAQSAASLNHPNIVSIHDVGSEGDIHYIVMELVQGKTLKEIITDEGILPWKWTVNIAIQIASALEVAHKNNIVHRDIKPHNIIITEDGTAKVTDFGIAKAVSNSTITSFGDTIGSVHYFSPEHAKGGSTNAKSDLYSLGVVMYEMLTGKVPFDADTPVSVALKHMQEVAVEPKQINTTIPDCVNKIIMKAMQKESECRYASAQEMLADLKEAIKNPNGDFVTINMVSPEGSKKSEENKEVNKKSKKKSSIKKKVIKIALIFIICIGIFALAMFGTIKMFNGNRVKQIQIPSLVGLNITEAKAKLNELGIKYELTEEFSPEGKEAGTILAQSPKYQDNYRINETEVMQIVVSKGIEMVTVPKIVGEEKDDGIGRLNGVGLRYEIIEENNDKVEAGIIIRQEPIENEEIAKGSTIKVYLSLGIEKKDVPSLIGKTEEEAKNAIEEAGLKYKTTLKISDTSKENNKIVDQKPEAGKTVDKGTEVTITLNHFEETKQGTVNINLKSLTGYKEEKDEEGKVKEPTDVEVMVKVTSNGIEDTVYKKSHKKNTEKISMQVEGVGTVTVKVFLDGIKEEERTMNLSSGSAVLNID